MALCIECSPAVQEVPSRISPPDALCRGCRWPWSSPYKTTNSRRTNWNAVKKDLKQKRPKNCVTDPCPVYNLILLRNHYFCFVTLRDVIWTELKNWTKNWTEELNWKTELNCSSPLFYRQVRLELWLKIGTKIIFS